MRVAVMGAGAVGGYLGGRLAEHGHDVTFIARGAQLEALRERGLTLDSDLGRVTISPARATDDPTGIGEVDLVLFTVKLYDAADAARAIRPLAGPATRVVTFQNGIECPDIVAAEIPRERILPGIAYIAASVPEPGIVRQLGNLCRFVIGDPAGGESERLAATRDTFVASGVAVDASSAIESELWKKFVAMAGWSGLNGVLRVDLGTIRCYPASMELIRQGIAEAVAVGRAKGVSLPSSALDEAFAILAEKASPDTKASLLQDLERGRRLELPWLSGTLVRHGESLGVPTPVHRFVMAALAPYIDGTPA